MKKRIIWRRIFWLGVLAKKRYNKKLKAKYINEEND